MQRLIQVSNLNNLTHVFLSNNRLNKFQKFGSHEYIADPSIKQQLASDLFEFYNKAYVSCGGFKSFTDEDDMVANSAVWRITYEGPFPNMENFDINKVYSATVFKQKFGLKMVAAGINRFKGMINRETLKARAKDSLIEDMKWAVQHGWAEVSHCMETVFKSNISSGLIIDPQVLIENGVFKDIQIEKDEQHYTRTLSTGDKVTKIAYGMLG